MRVSDGTSTVDITGAILDIEALADRVAPQIKREFEATARRIIRAADDLWPHRTGKSYRGIRVITRLHPDHLETVITNKERYAFMLKWSRYTRDELRASGKTTKQARYLRRRHGKGAPRDAWIEKRPWTEILRKPARKAEEPLAERLEDDLFRLADRGDR